MALSTALYTVLRLNENVVSTFATRIYPGAAPMEATLPLLVYEIENILPTTAKDDVTCWDEAEISVTVISTKHSTTETYAQYVRTALDGYTGTQDSEKIVEIVYRSQSAAYDDNWVYSGAAQGIAVFIRTLYFTLIKTY